MTLTLLSQQFVSIEESVNYSASLLVTYLGILLSLWLSNILVKD